MRVQTYRNGEPSNKERVMAAETVLMALGLSLADDDVMSVTVVFNDGTSFMAMP